MKVLVTGAAGFLGSHFAERLVARGDRVVGLDNFDPFYPRAIKLANLAGLLGHERFDLVEGDVTDPRDLERALAAPAREPFDAVVHLAALAGVRPSLGRAARYLRVNVEGTANVAEAMVTAGVTRLVFASSSSVYGDTTPAPFDEDAPADAPCSPYAATKRAAELALRAHVNVTDARVVALRYFTIYGPRQRPEMAVHAFARAMLRGEPITLYGSSASRRDYTFVADAVEGTVRALDQVTRRDHEPRYRVFNVGNAGSTPLGELVTSLARALGVAPKLEHRPAALGDVLDTFASLTRARAELGYEPRTSLAEGLDRFAAWYHAERARLEAALEA